MLKQKYLIPIVALIVANALWGLNTVFIKIGTETISPALNVGLRFIVASFILLPFAIRSWRPLKRWDLLMYILSSIFTITLSSLTLNLGLAQAPAFNAAAIWLLGPIMLLVCSHKVLREKISFKVVLGISIALVGSFIVIGKPMQVTSSINTLTGNLFLLLSVILNTIAILISKPLMKKASAAQATFLTLFPGTVPVLVYALSQLDRPSFDRISSRSWSAFWISILVVVGANFLFYFALGRKKANTVGVYSYLDPLVTVIAAWYILAERPAPGFVLGAILIVFGVYFAEIKKATAHIAVHRHSK